MKSVSQILSVLHDLNLKGMNMRKILIAFAVLLTPSLAQAGGHSGLGGTGTGITVDNEVMEGKTGVLIKNTTSDVWTWDNPPEGFHKATAAT